MVVKVPRAPRLERGSVTAVLGPEMLGILNVVVEKTSFPSGMKAAPGALGTAGGGSYSAAEWRTLLLFIIPAAILQTWGQCSSTTREHRMLCNFLHLVAAMRQTLRKRIRPLDISVYTEEIQAYLGDLVELYPGTSISPYQHRSAHYGDTMRLLGPPPGYNTGPYEQLNGRMKKINVNQHPGLQF